MPSLMLQGIERISNNLWQSFLISCDYRRTCTEHPNSRVNLSMASIVSERCFSLSMACLTALSHPFLEMILHLSVKIFFVFLAPSQQTSDVPFRSASTPLQPFISLPVRLASSSLHFRMLLCEAR